jgi:hypothetical protein
MSKPAESNKSGFVFGESTEEGPNKVVGVVPIETYLVQYTDGAGKKCVRIVFKMPGAADAFVLQERIQGSHVATAGTPWFNTALTQKLKEAGLAKGGPEGAEAI